MSTNQTKQAELSERKEKGGITVHINNSLVSHENVSLVRVLQHSEYKVIVFSRERKVNYKVQRQGLAKLGRFFICQFCIYFLIVLTINAKASSLLKYKVNVSCF